MAASIFLAFLGLSVSVRAWFMESIRLMKGVTNGRCRSVFLTRLVLFPPLQAFVVFIRIFDINGANMQKKVEAAKRSWPFWKNWKPVALSVKTSTAGRAAFMAMKLPTFIPFWIFFFLFSVHLDSFQSEQDLEQAPKQPQQRGCSGSGGSGEGSEKLDEARSDRGK